MRDLCISFPALRAYPKRSSKYRYRGYCEFCPHVSFCTRLELYQNEEVERLLNKGARYLSNAKRGDRPSGIAWIVRNHPEVSDMEIVRLLRTTKATITSIRERTHKNIQNIHPKNPVTLGLCSEADLNRAIALSVKKVTQ